MWSLYCSVMCNVVMVHTRGWGWCLPECILLCRGQGLVVAQEKAKEGRQGDQGDEGAAGGGGGGGEGRAPF